MTSSKDAKHGGAGTVTFPVGVEKALYLAASDRGFKAKLIGRREEALGDQRLKLDESERALLLAVPAEQLQAMIDRIDPKAHSGRGFLRSVAACTAVLVTTTATVSCGTGTRPDDVEDAHVEQTADGSQDLADAELEGEADAGSSDPDAGT